MFDDLNRPFFLIRVAYPKFNGYAFPADMTTGSMEFVFNKAIDIIEFTQTIC